MHISLCNGDFFFFFSLPGPEKKLAHSTICQFPLEMFNTNKIYGLSFQRVLPEAFKITPSVLKYSHCSPYKNLYVAWQVWNAALCAESAQEIPPPPPFSLVEVEVMK